MQAGVFLGEAGEALKMVADRGQKLFLGLSNYLSFTSGNALKSKFVKRGKVQKKALMQYLSENWLEYSFGWSPLVKDIEDAQKAYNDVLGKTNGRMERIYCYANDNSYTSFPEAPTRVSVGNVRYVRTKWTTGGCKVRYIIFLRYEAQGHSGPFYGAEEFGLIRSEFVPTVWELIPWSFCVDYFTNIGDLLAAQSTCQSNVQFVVKTVIRYALSYGLMQVDDGYMRSLYPDSSRYQWTGRPGNSLWTRRTVVRSSQGNLYYPELTVSVPTRPLQWLNLAALAVVRATSESTLVKRFGRLG